MRDGFHLLRCRVASCTAPVGAVRYATDTGDTSELTGSPAPTGLLQRPGHDWRGYLCVTDSAPPAAA
jgi:hypothetical protein